MKKSRKSLTYGSYIYVLYECDDVFQEVYVVSYFLWCFTF